MINLLKGISCANQELLREKEISKAIDKCVQEMGKYSGVDRCYIFTIKTVEDEMRLFYDFEWCSKDEEPFIGYEALSNMPFDTLPGLYEKLVENNSFYGFVEDHRENELFYELMTTQGIKTFLFLPIFKNSTFWGIIGFDNCKEKRVWNKNEVFALKTVADNIGLKLDQSETLEELSRVNIEKSLFLESTEMIFWEYITSSNQFKINKEVGKPMLLKDIPEVINDKDFFKIIHPSDRENFKNSFNSFVKNKKKTISGECRIFIEEHKQHSLWVRFNIKKITHKKQIDIVGHFLDIQNLKSIESELKLQKDTISLLVDNLNEAIIKLDSYLNILYVTEKWLEISGYKTERSIGMNLRDLFTPAATFKLERFLQSKEVNASFEFLLIHKNKHKIWVNFSLVKTFTNNGDFFLAGSIANINDKKMSELELKATKKDLAFVIDALGAMVYSSDMVNNKVKFYSKSKILADSDLDIIANNPEVWHSKIHPDDLDKFNQVSKEFKDVTTGSLVYRVMYNSDKEYKWVNDKFIITKDNKGNFQRIDGVITDIDKYVSEKLKYEYEIEKSESKYKFLTESSKDLICIIDNEGVLQYCNESCNNILQYTSDQMHGKSFRDFVYEEDKALFNEFKGKNKDHLQLDYRVYTKEGEIIWLQSVFSPLFNNGNEAEGLIIYSRNITQQKSTEKKLIDALEKEKNLGQLKSKFVSIVSHQFRTPLTVIYSNSELIEYNIEKGNFSKEKLLKFNYTIRNEINRMVELMDNVLLFGKWESNQIKLNLKDTKIKPLIEQFLESYFNSHNQNAITSVLKITESDSFIIDEQLFSHVLINLISNSIKYSKNSAKPILTLHTVKGNLIIKVEDFGIGIPENEKDKIFQSFYRATNALQFPGHGLGLLISKNFTELMNGEIKLSSKIGQGTTVELKFPLNQ